MQRRLDLDGPSNFRDLGGLPITGGGSTRSGLVYRADRLCTLSDADVRRLEAAGIRHVFDLRSETEAADFPDRLPAGALYVRLSMTSDQTFQARTIYERIVDGEIKSYGEADMVSGYLRMLQNFGPSLARIVRQVGQGEPTVIHCTAGKDRTGVASMLLLDLAGGCGRACRGRLRAVVGAASPASRRTKPRPGRWSPCSRTTASTRPSSRRCGRPVLR